MNNDVKKSNELLDGILEVKVETHSVGPITRELDQCELLLVSGGPIIENEGF